MSLHLGILGAGQMGAGIAAAAIRAGFAPTMVDANPAILEAGATRARTLAAGRSRAAAGLTVGPGTSRLEVSTSLAAMAPCDVVIEAVTEDEAVKTSAFGALGDVLGEAAILASNTSTIPISRMARSWIHPERFAGMHFFHPAQRMALVEVIRGEQTSDETVGRLVDLSKTLGKTPIVLADCPGFLVTRVLFPYLSQAIDLVNEGVPIDEIDAAAVAFGMPTGPIALLDFIGLDTVLAISRTMAEGYPDRARVSPLLADLVRLGRLGVKSGGGFRKHDGGGPPVADPDVAPLLRQHEAQAAGPPPSRDAITDRLFLPMLLEAMRAVADGIVRDPADVDTAVTLGLGFPTSRGGLFPWCEREGADTLLARAARYPALGCYLPSRPLRG